MSFPIADFKASYIYLATDCNTIKCDGACWFRRQYDLSLESVLRKLFSLIDLVQPQGVRTYGETSWESFTFFAVAVFGVSFTGLLLFLGSHIFLVELHEQRGKSTLVEIYSLFDSQETLASFKSRVRL